MDVRVEVTVKVGSESITLTRTVSPKPERQVYETPSKAKISANVTEMLPVVCAALGLNEGDSPF